MMDLFGGHRDMLLVFLEGTHIPRRPISFWWPDEQTRKSNGETTLLISIRKPLGIK